MLRDAARLHLDLVAEAIDEGLILKDATSYNVQFIGRAAGVHRHRDRSPASNVVNRGTAIVSSASCSSTR